MNLDSRERALTFELKEALTSSLRLPVVQSLSQGVLFQLLPADHAAWCVSRQGHPSEYDWVVTDRLAAFMDRYHEMAGEDFVRGAVVHLPNVVLRDSEMAPREVVKRSRPYLLCRELGTPLEHVMSVRLDMRQGWHGGLTLYREERPPFTERDRALLQWLTPFLARTVRNCRMLGGVAAGGGFPEALSLQHGLECLVLTPAFTEVMRTARVTTLLREWFTPFELGPSGLPREWLEKLAWLVRLEEEGGFGSDIWERHREDRRLRVTFIRMPQQEGRRLWALVLDESSHFIPVPADWRLLLTPRETEIVSYVLQNFYNEAIAAHLHIKLLTVKTHLKNIFKKLGLENRSDLLYQAALQCLAARE